MAELWGRIRADGAAGVLWLTSDIALDPDDLAAMLAAVGDDPGAVHTGLVKLWPISTGRDSWIYSHRGGTVGNPVVIKDETAPVMYFSIDCVWTPAVLLDLAWPDLPAWAWNTIDVRLSEIAGQAGIAARVVPGCRPKHLHFTREHDGRTDQHTATGAVGHDQRPAELGSDRQSSDRAPRGATQ